MDIATFCGHSEVEKVLTGNTGTLAPSILRHLPNGSTSLRILDLTPLSTTLTHIDWTAKNQKNNGKKSKVRRGVPLTLNFPYNHSMLSFPFIYRALREMPRPKSPRRSRRSLRRRPMAAVVLEEGGVVAVLEEQKRER